MISPKKFVRETDFKPKKMLGQNFLVHSEGAEKIVRFAGVTENDSVLEIGPGLGALTNALLETGCEVVSIEKDSRLVKALSEHEKFKNKKFTLIHQDALELSFDALPPRPQWKVVANLPYSISTPLLEVFLSHIERVESMVLLLQEEVVDRICAVPDTKDYGRLSIWVQILCATERGFRVPRGSFFPIPDVESRLVRLTPIPLPLIPRKEQPEFLKFVGKLFQQRRKSIRHMIRPMLPETTNVDEFLQKNEIDPLRRSETFSIPELYSLSKLVQ